MFSEQKYVPYPSVHVPYGILEGNPPLLGELLTSQNIELTGNEEFLSLDEGKKLIRSLFQILRQDTDTEWEFLHTIHKLYPNLRLHDNNVEPLVTYLQEFVPHMQQWGHPHLTLEEARSSARSALCRMQYALAGIDFEIQYDEKVPAHYFFADPIDNNTDLQEHIVGIVGILVSRDLDLMETDFPDYVQHYTVKYLLGFGQPPQRLHTGSSYVDHVLELAGEFLTHNSYSDYSRIILNQIPDDEEDPISEELEELITAYNTTASSNKLAMYPENFRRYPTSR